MGIIPRSKKGRAWVQQENALEAEGHRKQPGSGSGDRKGDNKGQNFLIEAKTTKHASRTISTAEFALCEVNARREDRLPLMQIQLKDQKKLALCRWEDFEALVEAANWKI